MVGLRQTTAFHHDTDEYGRPLTAADREKLISPYLPEGPITASPARTHRSTRNKSKGKPGPGFVRSSLYALIFGVIHFLFSIYIRFRRAYRNVKGRVLGVLYYHHRTPELIQRDVKSLSKLPRHLSIILELQENSQHGAALESLVNDVCECAAWSACAGVPQLSIYERTGEIWSLCGCTTY